MRPDSWVTASLAVRLGGAHRVPEHRPDRLLATVVAGDCDDHYARSR